MIQLHSTIYIFKGFNGLEIDIFHEYNYIIEILLNEYLNPKAVEKIFNMKKLNYFKYLCVEDEVAVHQISGRSSIYPTPIITKKY